MQIKLINLLVANFMLKEIESLFVSIHPLSDSNDKKYTRFIFEIGIF
jgi:hypothetical protein